MFSFSFAGIQPIRDVGFQPVDEERENEAKKDPRDVDIPQRLVQKRENAEMFKILS